MERPNLSGITNRKIEGNRKSRNEANVIYDVKKWTRTGPKTGQELGSGTGADYFFGR